MNKSTPLNQLPNHPASPAFMTDQQRQIVSQAQQAAQNFTLPQNTQASSDIINVDDDDATVQEVLQQLNQKIPISAPPPPPPPPPSLHEPPSQTTADFVPHAAGPSPAEFGGYGAAAYGYGGGFPMVQDASGASRWYAIWEDKDVKLLGIVLIAYAAVTLLPVEKLVYHYVALHHVPYSNLIIKAVLCALAVYFLKKLFVSARA